MRPFVFAAAADARTVRDVLAREPGARVLAGGTTLVDLMRLGVERPSHVVDINELPLDCVETLGDGTLRIGALVRNSDLARDARVRKHFPMLAQAVRAGASPQVRNMATTAGNLLQRTRCYYFRDAASSCNKREPGTGCPAIDGYNRIHAVLGTSGDCIASHPSDMAVALAALDAVVRIEGPGGERTVSAREFHLLPDAHPERETVLEHAELVTAVDVPPLPWAGRSLYLKVRDRAAFAFALASAAVALDLAGDRVRAARVALGGVGTKPWHSPEAERVLAGSPCSPATFSEAADAALAGAVGRRHNAFKIELAKRTLVRALTQAAALP